MHPLTTKLLKQLEKQRTLNSQLRERIAANKMFCLQLRKLIGSNKY